MWRSRAFFLDENFDINKDQILIFSLKEKKKKRKHFITHFIPNKTLYYKIIVILFYTFYFVVLC